MKRPVALFHTALLLAGLAALPVVAAPFVSGSTGADGAFAPTANTTVQLPPNGVLNYTTVDIPAGVTVKFARNAANTAAVILTTGAVKIGGVIDVSGGNSLMTKVGLGGDVNKGGVGGPGGFDGARGGLPEQNRMGGSGLGPGGGGGGITATGGSDQWHCFARPQGGGGGGFAAAGEASQCIRAYGAYDPNARSGFAGPAYGANAMLPLVGGSGGGGGAGGQNSWSLPGTGGGGGGGALMIVATGPVELAGTILARGGSAGNINNNNCTSTADAGGAGGGGAGGMIRIITPGFNATGATSIAGGTGGCRGGGATSIDQVNAGGHGSAGRSSVEIVTGGTFSVAALPSLAITSIGGVAVPANPTGAGDVNLPAEASNPAEVTIAASGVPLGTIVKLTLSQPYNVNVTANASALAGTVAASTSTGSISIPSGTSVLMASTTYALTLAQGQALSIYAQGEQVQKVELAATLGGPSKVTLITISGKTFEVPAAVLAMLPS